VVGDFGGEGGFVFEEVMFFLGQLLYLLFVELVVSLVPLYLPFSLEDGILQRGYISHE
jgi:hypothetical protein